MVNCYGGNDGKAIVNASGGTIPYSYNWTPITVGTSTVAGLSIGDYTVVVTDVNNCKSTSTVAITQPLAPLTSTATSAPTICAGGSSGTATVTAIGGTSGYNYTWTPSGGNASTANGLTQGNYVVYISDSKNCQTNVVVVVSSPQPVSGSLTSIPEACLLSNGSASSQIFGGIGPYTYTWLPTNTNTYNNTNLTAGTYTLKVLDSKNCPLTLTTTVGSVGRPTIVVSGSKNVDCFLGAVGEATVSVNQGTAPYIINWYPYGGSATTASSLTAGTYTAKVQDSRGCVNNTTITITEPTQIALSIVTQSNVSCFGLSNASVNVVATGGTAGYNYSWAPSGNSNSLINIAAGVYTVVTFDANFCTTSLEVTITEPPTLSVTIASSVNPTCFNSSNGSATANAFGGTAPYSFNWSTTPIQNNITAINLMSGSYTATVNDTKGCVSSVTVNITEPPQVVTNTSLNDTACVGQIGTISAFATGGSGGYYYAWQPGAITNSGTLTVNPAITSINYSVVAYDQNGCAGNVDTARVVVYSLTNSNINAIGFSPVCPNVGTTIYAETTGDTGPLTYSWNNNLGTGPGAFVSIPTQASTYYVVTVTNACGQTLKDSVEVVQSPQPTINVASGGTLACIPTSIKFTDASLAGNSADPITTWLWNFGDGLTSNSVNPTHVYNSPGTYSVTLTVSTNGGCINNNSSTPIIVSAFNSPLAQFAVNSLTLSLPYNPLLCTNQSTGAVSYDWSFGDGNFSQEVHPKHLYTLIGDYQVQLIATSIQGCKDTATILITADADIVFPNAFTPNEEGGTGGSYDINSLTNDVFFPFTSGVEEYSLQIFNRWGELIFESTDVKMGWDGYYRGKLCQLGVYVWKAKVKLNNGKLYNKMGDVTLMR